MKGLWALLQELTDEELEGVRWAVMDEQRLRQIMKSGAPDPETEKLLEDAWSEINPSRDPAKSTGSEL